MPATAEPLAITGGHSWQAARLLNISVGSDLLRRWRGWFAPPVQPFRVDLMSPALAELLPHRTVDPTPEWEDTFATYSGTWTWLDEPQFLALQPSQRRSLLAVRRRSVRPKLPPAWPSELAAAGDRLLLDWIASGTVRPSLHAEVPADVWDRAEPMLPEARRLAGTFAVVGSGPKLFRYRAGSSRSSRYRAQASRTRRTSGLARPGHRADRGHLMRRRPGRRVPVDRARPDRSRLCDDRRWVDAHQTIAVLVEPSDHPDRA